MLGSPCGTQILKKYRNELNELSTVATFLDVDNIVCMAGKTRLFQWFHGYTRKPSTFLDIFLQQTVWISESQGSPNHGWTSDTHCDARKMTRSSYAYKLSYGSYVEVMLTYGAGLVS